MLANCVIGTSAMRTVEQSVGRLMLERVAGFVRRHADRGDGLAVKIVRRKEQRALRRVVMVAQTAGDFLHRHVGQAGAVKDFARRFRAGHAGIHRHLAVFAVGMMQLDLRPDAEEQARNQEQPIQWIKQVKHKTIN